MRMVATFLEIDGVPTFCSGLGYKVGLALDYFDPPASTWSIVEALGSYGSMLALSTSRHSQRHWHYYYYPNIRHSNRSLCARSRPVHARRSNRPHCVIRRRCRRLRISSMRRALGFV